MIVWGGFGDSGDSGSTGGIYDPETDSWATLSTADAPSARGAHTAVWTGTRMIVWGGSENFSYLSTGGAYDPSTDTWTPTSTVEAPSPRWVTPRCGRDRG